MLNRLCLLILTVGIVRAISQKDALQVIMENYTRDCSRPVSDTDTLMKVNVQFHIDKLVEIDEPGSGLTAHIHLNMMWIDEFLKWSDIPSVELVDSVVIEAYRIWTPPIILVNEDFDKYKLLQIPIDHKYRARVHRNGTVELQTAGLATTHCVYDALLYPYDVQICDYEFNVFPFTEHEISLSTDHNPSHNTEDKNPVWSLNAVHAREEEELYHGVHLSTLQMRICIRRAPLFFFLTVILPVFVLAVLLLANLFQPVGEATERVNHNLELLAALVFFYIILVDEFPRSSQTTSLFAIYVTTLISFAALSAILLIIVKRFTTAKSKPPSKLMKASAKVSRTAKKSIASHDLDSEATLATQLEERGRVSALADIGERLAVDAVPAGTDPNAMIMKELHRKLVLEVEEKESNRKQWIILAKIINIFLVTTGVLLILVMPFIMFVFMSFDGDKQNDDCINNVHWEEEKQGKLEEALSKLG